MKLMKRVLTLVLSTCMLLGTGVLVACQTNPETDPTGTPTETPTATPTENAEPTDTPAPTAEPTSAVDYAFDGSISEEVLCNYLARAVHLCGEQKQLEYMPTFIKNTGAKYICRAACCWNPSASDYKTYDAQKTMLETVHANDPDVVLEACIFECVGTGVEGIAIPTWVFEAFDEPVEERNFSFKAMQFPSGKYVGQWGNNTAVPDITQLETRMFFYYRACTYIDLGYEALHMGQVHLMGSRDTGWKYYTELFTMIREYAYKNARRSFVFLNAHSHGIIGADGNLLFDFHMYPSRFLSDTTQEPHYATEDNPQRGYMKNGYSDSIYGKSMGGTTYSGWTCDSLPYLVEFDNFGDQTQYLNKPVLDNYTCWGMDEITWFANQPASYRKEILQYVYYWMQYYAEGTGFISMPGQRVVRIYDENGKVTGKAYYGYDPSYFAGGFGDELVIKALWAGELKVEKDDEIFWREVEEEKKKETKTSAEATGDVLRFDFTANVGASDTIAYSFLPLPTIDYQIQKGDKLEYDVYIATELHGLGAVDGVCIDKVTIRDTSTCLDANAKSAHPKTDLTAYAGGQWYHRVLPLDTGALAGNTLAYLMLAAHPETANGKFEKGTYTVYYDNIRITNDGDTQLVVFADEEDFEGQKPAGFSHKATSTASVRDISEIE